MHSRQDLFCIGVTLTLPLAGQAIFAISYFSISHSLPGKYRLFLNSYLPFNQSFKLSSVPS